MVVPLGPPHDPPNFVFNTQLLIGQAVGSLLTKKSSQPSVVIVVNSFALS